MTALLSPAGRGTARGGTVLDTYRDDGPLALAVGRVLGSIGASPLLLSVVGVLPVTVLMLAGGRPSLLLVGLAIAWLVLLAGIASGRPHTGRLAWLVPPVLRAAEYVVLLRFAHLAGGRAVSLCFALLCALAFHHYDSVYRLRHQRLAPPRWLVAAGGGWDGRLVAAWVLSLLGVLTPALLVGAIVLGLLYAGESTVSWLRFSSAQRPALYADDEDEDE